VDRSRRWESNVGLRKTGWEDANWINVAQGTDQWRALENAVVNLQVT
jgi:hypothetical protein